ncbi:D-tyrosyl-tRNA(Tyr) deacylase [Candidatus Pacearchaeota archaeon]|nr:D-tyrosyl-tRNA(Tyr) deacylase [Candidatus Pacearchaeota archaeon]
MKCVLQRVNNAKVDVDGKTVGSIDKGLLIFLGISKGYNEAKLDWMVNKILKLRLWGSSQKGFDNSVTDISGEILVVSQFTLYADCSKGTKPSFEKSMEARRARDVYDLFIEKLKEKSELKIEQGNFGATMKVSLENDGPVTIILEK